MKTVAGFRFDLDRAIQAAGVVLRDHGTMDRMRLLKILYIASRKAFLETGKPIVGGRTSALENGPLHSEVYDQIKGSADDVRWHEFFHNVGHTIELVKDPGRLDLSPLEIDLINETAEWAEQFETFELSRWTHENLPEYQKNEPQPGSSKLISVNDLLDALGLNAAEVQDLLSELRSQEEFLAALETHQ